MTNIVPLFIAFRYSQSSQTTSFVAFINRFSVAGIALGLMALITVISIMNGFEDQLKRRVLGVVPHLVIHQSNADSIQDHPSVEAVMDYEEVEGVIQSKSAIRGIQIQGIAPDVMIKHSVFNDFLLFGQLALEPESFDVIIGRSLAVQMGINPGDMIRLLVAGKATYTPFGRIPSQKLVRVVGFFDLSSQVDDTVVLMHWKDVKKLQRDRGNKPSSQRIFLYDAFDYHGVEDTLRTQQIDSTSWRTRQGTLFDAVKMEKNLMFIMLLLIVAVAAFNIISALVMVVTEKQSDIAILQTQGMTPTGIMCIFLLNGVLNGLKGSVIGCVLGALLIIGINPLLSLIGFDMALSADGKAVPIVVDLMEICLVVGLSILLCVLASLYPSYRAMGIKPAIALHNG